MGEAQQEVLQLSALHKAGLRVELFEKTSFPRQKVCGEFLSKQAVALLEEAGLAGRFFRLRPAPINTLRVFWRDHQLQIPLPEPAFGISRYRFDQTLFEAALELGIRWHKERLSDWPEGAIVAVGRQPKRVQRNRFFGFQAHFRGSWDDVVEMHFFQAGYVGLNPVEEGLVNVCGLVSESWLRGFLFDFDAALRSLPAIWTKLEGLEQVSRWIATAPVQTYLGNPACASEWYLAGDVAAFIDPFTGSGICNALFGGMLAADSLIGGDSPKEHHGKLLRSLRRPYHVAAFIRKILDRPAAARAFLWLPLELFYRWTRIDQRG